MTFRGSVSDALRFLAPQVGHPFLGSLLFSQLRVDPGPRDQKKFRMRPGTQKPPMDRDPMGMSLLLWASVTPPPLKLATHRTQKIVQQSQGQLVKDLEEAPSSMAVLRGLYPESLMGLGL